ncbi:MAG: endonuclease/exonuclease/phosphatase family protein, partial [Verrucomicrobiota bacterium]
ETRNLKALRLLNRNLNPPQFSHLASSLFYQENIESNLDDKVRQELGLLSRYPWEAIWEIDFGVFRGKNRPTRGWLAARFKIGDHDITIYNGHLKSNYGAENPKDRERNIKKRDKAIDQLSKDLDRVGLDPYRDKIVVVGDFNADFFSSEFSDEKAFEAMERLGFHHTFLLSSTEKRITLPAKEGEPWPDGTFDYIFLSSGWKLKEVTAQVMAQGAAKRSEVYGGDEPGLASDHYPVFIDLPLE